MSSPKLIPQRLKVHKQEIITILFMKKDSEKKPGKPAFDPKDLVDEPIPCVYGPPEWYDSHGNLDNNHPSARRFKERILEIEERNRQRRMQREREAQDCDARIEKVYGPMPPTLSVNDTRKVNIEELVDMPTEDLYGPMPPGVDDPYMLMYGPMPPIDEIVIPEKEGKDEDKKEEKEEVAEGKRGFFARLFGKKRS